MSAATFPARVANNSHIPKNGTGVAEVLAERRDPLPARRQRNAVRLRDTAKPRARKRCTKRTKIQNCRVTYHRLLHGARRPRKALRGPEPRHHNKKRRLAPHARLCDSRFESLSAHFRVSPRSGYR